MTINTLRLPFEKQRASARIDGLVVVDKLGETNNRTIS